MHMGHHEQARLNRAGHALLGVVRESSKAVPLTGRGHATGRKEYRSVLPSRDERQANGI